MTRQEYNSRIALALAKQVAMYNGQIYEKLNEKNKAALLTLANSLLATVWRIGSAKDVS